MSDQSLHSWLTTTRAADLMTTRVVTLHDTDPMSFAAEILLDNHLSGAPVVNSSEQCVGVLSVKDLLHAERIVAEEQDRIMESEFWHTDLALPQSFVQNKLAAVKDKLIPSADQVVERFMSPRVLSVTESDTLQTIVHHMSESHIHRLIVLDQDKKVVGLVSSTNVLSALSSAGSSS